MTYFTLLNCPSCCATLWGIIVVAAFMLNAIVVVQSSPHNSSTASSNVFVCPAQPACTRACQHPIQTAVPFSVVHVDPARPVRPTGTSHHPTDAAARGERSGCLRARRLVSGAVRTAHWTRVYVWMDRGRGRGLGAMARGRRGLGELSCVLLAIIINHNIRIAYQSNS
jgi:hypothetical protein